MLCALDNAVNYMIAFNAVVPDPKTVKQWPLRPMPIPWQRGPAWIDGEDIVMDSARASAYHPLAKPGIGIELARVRTPEDAVAFVNRFGLLHGHTSLRDRPLKPLREPFTLFEATAYDLRHILETEQLVRRGTKGDAAAIDRLRQLLVIPEDEDMQIWDPEAGEHVTRRAGDVYSPDERWVGADDRTILLNAHEHYVAHALDEGMEGSPVRIHDPAAVGESVPPGGLRIGIRPDSLAVVCYLSVALALVDRVPIGVCADPTCGRPFFIIDKRQRFCSKACGNRVRFRRFMDKHGTATNAEGEGD